jgi:hypothetical protein
MIQFPVSSAHESMKSARKSIREDLLSFCEDKYFPSSWIDEGNGFHSYNGVEKFL